MRPCSVLKCKEYDSAQYGGRLRRVKEKVRFCASRIRPIKHNILYLIECRLKKVVLWHYKLISCVQLWSFGGQLSFCCDIPQEFSPLQNIGNSYRLVIGSIVEQDFGDYRCRASNPLEEDVSQKIVVTGTNKDYRIIYARPAIPRG